MAAKSAEKAATLRNGTMETWAGQKPCGIAAESLAERLGKYSNQSSQIEGLRDEVANQAGRWRTADDAGEALIKQGRARGLSGSKKRGAARGGQAGDTTTGARRRGGELPLELSGQGRRRDGVQTASTRRQTAGPSWPCRPANAAARTVATFGPCITPATTSPPPGRATKPGSTVYVTR